MYERVTFITSKSIFVWVDACWVGNDNVTKEKKEKTKRALNTQLCRGNGTFCPFRQWRLPVRDGNADDTHELFEKAFVCAIFSTADCKCRWRCLARSLPDAVPWSSWVPPPLFSVRGGPESCIIAAHSLPFFLTSFNLMSTVLSVRWQTARRNARGEWVQMVGLVVLYLVLLIFRLENSRGIAQGLSARVEPLRRRCWGEGELKERKRICQGLGQ